MKPQAGKLGTEKIPKILWKMSLPAIIGLFVMSLYHLVDTIFVGRGVGSLAIAGVSVTFPVQMLGIAIAQTLGIGAASIISRALGASKYRVAQRALGNFLLTILVVSVLYAILGLVFLEPLMRLSGATPDIIDISVRYMRIMFYGMVFFAFASGSNNIIRSEGNAKFAMGVMVSSALLNVVLDYIFIFPLGWGVEGAAWASVISQAVAAGIVVVYLAKGFGSLRVCLSDCVPDWNIIKETFAIGGSSFARMSVGSVVVIILNNLIGIYGGAVASLSIAAFGMINRVIMLVFLPILGLVQGLQPVLGFNYGAKKFARARNSVMISIKMATLISVGSFVILYFFANPIMSIFTTDSQLINLSAGITRIIIIVLPLIGFQIVAAGMYQAIGKAVPALVLSLLRQLILFLPLVIILPMFFGFNGLWYAFPAADVLAGVVTFFMLRKELSKLKILAVSSPV